MIGLDAFYFREYRCGVAALEQTIRYQRELRIGDAVEIRSQIDEVKEKTIRATHTMRKVNSDEVSASTTILAVHFDTSLRKSVPLPMWARERASEWIVAYGAPAGESL
jgi:acyl-CoA thioesterase FadM